MQVVHYSIQGNHLHLIVEADDAAALSRGLQGLLIRVARSLNRVAGRRGKLLRVGWRRATALLNRR
jgi:hypothetical protein